MTHAVIWHDEQLSEFVGAGRSARDIRDYLTSRGCFVFTQLPSGLFPAIRTDAEKDQTGYADAWLRDSACIALNLWRSGERELAARAGEGVLTALGHSTDVLRAVAGGAEIHRPTVRFHGANAEPLQDWPNAQNDALGYAMCLIGTLSQAKALELSEQHVELFDSLVGYLKAIPYWRDEDSGHWEESAKCGASSIGAVVAGLQAVRPIVSDPALVDELITEGRQALKELLPNESRTPGQERDADGAVLFLVQPLGVVDDEAAEQVVQLVQRDLEGEIGVKRYVGDSYWAPDYRDHFQMGDRAVDFTNRMDERAAFLEPGLEAQWSLFDPMLAIYYAKEFKQTGDAEHATQAQQYLSRSLAQILDDQGELKMPEAYFYEHDAWVPNDHNGLLWAESNLLYALAVFEEVFGSDAVARSSE
jgi:hypothetical protein